MMLVGTIIDHCFLVSSLYSSVVGAKSAAGASAEVTEDDSTCKLLLIHGGMDTQGEIFDDCLVYRIS